MAVCHAATTIIINRPTGRRKEMIPAARKTTSTEVKRRYNDRVYCKVQAELPRDTVTAFKAKCKVKGISQASVLLEAIENFLRD